MDSTFLNFKLPLNECKFDYTHENEVYRYFTLTIYGTSTFYYVELKKTKTLKLRALATVKSLGYKDMKDFFNKNPHAIDNWLDGINNGNIIEYNSIITLEKQNI